MEHNKSNYQPPLLIRVEMLNVGVYCSSILLTTDDSNYINGEWED